MTTITPDIDPAFTFEGAYELGAIDEGLIIEQAVGGTDRGDAYVFSVGEAGKYTLTLDGLSADANIALLNIEGEVVDYSNLGGVQSEVMTQDLAEGEYYLAVVPYDEEETDYTIDISTDETVAAPNGNAIVPSIDPGEDPETSFDLGVVDTNVLVEDSVSLEDEGDVYEFTVEEAGEYTFNLDGFTSDLGFLIVNSEDIGADGLPTDTVTGSNNPGTEAETSTAELDPGTYYATVISLEEDAVETDYSFSFGTGAATETGAEIIAPPSDPGSTVEDSFDVGSLSGTFSVAESTGTEGVVEDISDVYEFTVDEAGEYSITLDGMSANADLFLVTGDEVIAISETTGTEADEIVEELEPGTYYAGVVPIDDVSTDYVLTFSDGTTATTDDDDSTASGDTGGTFDTATPIGELTAASSEVFSEDIGGVDTFDVFQFSVADTQEFSAVVSGLDADVDLGLYDSEGETVFYSATDGNVDEEIAETITAGDYYLGVYSYDGVETSYDLTISGGAESSSPSPSPSLISDATATTSEDSSFI